MSQLLVIYYICAFTLLTKYHFNSEMPICTSGLNKKLTPNNIKWVNRRILLQSTCLAVNGPPGLHPARHRHGSTYTSAALSIRSFRSPDRERDGISMSQNQWQFHEEIITPALCSLLPKLLLAVFLAPRGQRVRGTAGGAGSQHRAEAG